MATTPAPPYLAVIFTNRQMPGRHNECEHTAVERALDFVHRP